MKKLAALAGSVALLLGMAGSVLAFGTDVENNFATVYNRVRSKANSGLNSIHGFGVGGSIVTGAAVSSPAVLNTVNSIEGCGCGFSTDVTRNMAFVTNSVKAKANTGLNSIGGFMVTGGYISAGAARAEAIVSNVVNSVVEPL